MLQPFEDKRGREVRHHLVALFPQSHRHVQHIPKKTKQENGKNLKTSLPTEKKTQVVKH